MLDIRCSKKLLQLLVDGFMVCVCVCGVFLCFPLSYQGAVIHTCRRLAVEFMHYVIASRSLRKVWLTRASVAPWSFLATSHLLCHFFISSPQVFLSIKGIYYQVEIEGQAITWITPYQFSQEVTAVIREVFV